MTTPSPQNDPDQSPVFLIGAARSGTSLLYKTLSLHPRLAYISNWVARCPAVPQLAVLNRIVARMPERQRTVWFGASGDNAYVYGSKRPNSERIIPMPAEAEKLYRRCGIPELRTDPPATSDNLEHLRQAFAKIRRAAGGDVVLSKRVADNRRIPTLLHAFPTARFVEIIRDGRAVAASLRKVDWWDDHIVFFTNQTPRQWEAGGGDPWELAGRNWAEEVAEIRTGLAEVPPDQAFSLRYEDMVASPIETLHDIVRFIGVPPTATFSSALSELSFPDKNDRWRDQLGADVVATIERAQQDQLSHYGYR